jgi:hypothetical protein
VVLERAQEMNFVALLVRFPIIEEELNNDECNGHIPSIWNMQSWYVEIYCMMKKVLR